MPEEATELEYLVWFFQTADFGPAHGDVVAMLNEEFEKEVGKLVPEGYRREE